MAIICRFNLVSDWNCWYFKKIFKRRQFQNHDTKMGELMIVKLNFLSSINCNQMTSKRTGVRAYSFTKKVENITSEDEERWTDELIGKMKKKLLKEK